MGRRCEQTFLQRTHTDGQQACEEVFNTNYQRNTNQNYNELSPHTGQDGHHQKFTNSRCWRRCREKGTLLRYQCECKWVQPLRRTVWWFLKKLKRELPYHPYYPTVLLLDIYLEKNKIQKCTCIPMFIEHCLQQLRHESKLNVHQING